MRLNLGCGGRQDPGWTHIDRAGDVDVLHDLTDLPLPFDDNSVEGAVAHHVLDLLNPWQLVDLVRDVRRVLVPGGFLRVSCAYLDAGIDAALIGNGGWFPEPRGNLETMLGWFITQGGARKTRVSPERLHDWLIDAGYFWVSTRLDIGHTFGPEWLVELDSRPEESFYLEAAK